MKLHARFVDAATGAIVDRSVDAEDEAAARRDLEQDGHIVIRMESHRRTVGAARGSRIALREFALELRALLIAGLGVVTALEAIAGAQTDAESRTAVLGVLERVRAGKSLSAALALFPDQFPPVFLAAVRGGEASARLPETLLRYAEYQQMLADLRRKVLGALIYPGVVLAFGAAVVLFLLSYVVPRFEAAYAAMPGGAPRSSATLLAIAVFVSEHIQLVLAAVLLAGWACWRGWQEPRLRVWVLARLSRVGWLARGIRAYALARLFRTLAMMVAGGHAIPESLKLGQQVVAGTPWAAEVDAARRRIESGKSVAECFAAGGLSNDITGRLISAGEQSARLAEMFDHAAEHHERELGWLVERSSRLVEPVLLMAVALIVGMIVVAMYTPIFDLASGLG